MEPKNPAYQLRLGKYPIIYIQGFSTIQRVVGNGISEASTVRSKWVRGTRPFDVVTIVLAPVITVNRG